MEKIPSVQRHKLIEEAKMQMRAIQCLGIWLRAALSIMVTGLLFAWWGLGMGAGPFRGVLGIAFAVIGGTAAYIIRLGRTRGKQNVERILKAAETECF